MKILITGDSFAADWQIKYPEKRGWPNVLSEIHDITNLAQAGCSEYRILKQIQSANLSDFDKIIIAHTSPFRLYVKNHPVHIDQLHCNCDLIYSDVKEHAKNNEKLLPLVDYFENYFDLDYAIDMHNIVCEKIDQITKTFDPIHITGFEWSGLYQFDNMLNFNYIFKKYRGIVNHYSLEGNLEVYESIQKRL